MSVFYAFKLARPWNLNLLTVTLESLLLPGCAALLYWISRLFCSLMPDEQLLCPSICSSRTDPQNPQTHHVSIRSSGGSVKGKSYTVIIQILLSGYLQYKTQSLEFEPEICVLNLVNAEINRYK